MRMFFEIFPKRGSHILLAAIAVVLTTVSASGAAQFRQLPELPMIPPSITFPAEREILQADLDRVKETMRTYDVRMIEYRRECDQRLVTNASRKRQCSYLAQGLHRDSSRLRATINALRNRFTAIERGVMQQRPSSDPAMRNVVAVASRDKRPKLIADALAAGDGSWGGVLAHVKLMMSRGMGDPAVRDVSAYLIGLHSARLAADMLENEYYKHGVRRAISGDHWSATLAFGRAARDTPDDRRVFESFADAAGRQHAEPACATSGRCITGNVADWAKRFGEGHDRALKRIDAAYQKGKLDPKTAGVFRILMAVAVYAAKKEAEPGEGGAPTTEAREMARSALAAAQGGDRYDAVQRYCRLWELIEPDRTAVFLFRYAQTSGAAEARAMYAVNPRSSTPSENDREYLDMLRQAYAHGDDASPFSGALTQAQIIRLQR